VTLAEYAAVSVSSERLTVSSGNVEARSSAVVELLLILEGMELTLADKPFGEFHDQGDALKG
jgi:hypothetical protein